MRWLIVLAGLVSVVALLAPTATGIYRSISAISDSEARFQYDGDRYVLPTRATDVPFESERGRSGPYANLASAQVAIPGLRPTTDVDDIELGSTVLLDTGDEYVALLVVGAPGRMIKVTTQGGEVHLYRKAQFERMFAGLVAPPAPEPIP